MKHYYFLGLQVTDVNHDARISALEENGGGSQNGNFMSLQNYIKYWEINWCFMLFPEMFTFQKYILTNCKLQILVKLFLLQTPLLSILHWLLTPQSQGNQLSYLMRFYWMRERGTFSVSHPLTIVQCNQSKTFPNCWAATHLFYQ